MKRFSLLMALTLGLSQSALSEPQSPDPECDFSSYKPLVISHALHNAAVKKVEPKYPGVAKSARGEGKVQVKILVDREGNVVDACAVQGHPLLRESSRRAALEWKFKRNFGFSNRQRRRYIQAWIVFTFKFDK